MDAALEKLLAAAIRAPSGDNTQPWRFVVDAAAGRIALHLDETRDPSPMNSGQRMARIAVGAALENLLQTARKSGWTAELEEAPGALAVVRFVGQAFQPDVRLESLTHIEKRVTNRRLYEGRPIPNEVR